MYEIKAFTRQTSGCPSYVSLTFIVATRVILVSLGVGMVRIIFQQFEISTSIELCATKRNWTNTTGP